MRNQILNLLFGIFISVLSLNAQEVNVPVLDETEEQTVKVVFEPMHTNVSFKNAVESLTQEQINRIVTTLEESGDAAIETSLMSNTVLSTLNTLLEEKAFMQNKVIYQANQHYNLSESEVKRSLRKHQVFKLFAYVCIMAVFMVAVKRTNNKRVFTDGFIKLDSLVTILLVFVLEAFTIWYIIRPLADIILNRDFETIKFLLQGA